MIRGMTWSSIIFWEMYEPFIYRRYVGRIHTQKQKRKPHDEVLIEDPASFECDSNKEHVLSDRPHAFFVVIQQTTGFLLKRAGR